MLFFLRVIFFLRYFQNHMLVFVSSQINLRWFDISWQHNSKICQRLGQHIAKTSNCSIVCCGKSLWIWTSAFRFFQPSTPFLCIQWEYTHPHKSVAPADSQIRQRQKCNWLGSAIFFVSCQFIPQSLLTVIQSLSLSLYWILSTSLAECQTILMICSYGCWTVRHTTLLSSLPCSHDTAGRTMGWML